MLFNRKLEPLIEKNLFKGKVIIVYGPRQVGKTTLVKQILNKYPEQSRYYLCDLIENIDFFSYQNASNVAKSLSRLKLVVIDEAQRIENIGLVLKIIHDLNPDLQILVTGSSSFDLANKINEPLTGRSLSFWLYPLAIEEIFDLSQIPDLNSQLPDLLRFGLYPNIYQTDFDQKAIILNELATNYLFKDILNWENLKNPLLLQNLLRMLALQLGSEVSYHELATTLRVDIKTIIRYLDLLEKAFIIFKLPAFSRNLRKEINKTRKYYFYDLGLRNSLIPNFKMLSQRTDVGPLWENFCILERKKTLAYQQKLAYTYFWRTYDQQEIDYIEDFENRLLTFEFKWNVQKEAKIPKIFASNYPDSEFKTITPKNLTEFLNIS